MLNGEVKTTTQWLRISGRRRRRRQQQKKKLCARRKRQDADAHEHDTDKVYYLILLFVFAQVSTRVTRVWFGGRRRTESPCIRPAMSQSYTNFAPLFLQPYSSNAISRLNKNKTFAVQCRCWLHFIFLHAYRIAKSNNKHRSNQQTTCSLFMCWYF